MELPRPSHILALLMIAAPTLAQACNVDVACDAAQPWRDEARSVARLVVWGTRVCSGTLVNNTAQDGTPYLLTALHCVPDQATADSVVVHWNYAKSRCDGQADGALDQTQTGAELVATDPATDLALLRLHQAPKPEFDVHYAGWDRRDLAPTGAVAIHHPSGREKHLSFDNDPLRITAAFGFDTAADGDFLMVEAWNTGATAAGSSGAGLWNAEHRLVGHYSGGYSACGSSRPDWFGRLARAWKATGAGSLGAHLDPAGLGAEVLDGKDFPDPADPSGGGGGLPPGVLLALIAAGFIRRRN